jgi:hypothetical protein
MLLRLYELFGVEAVGKNLTWATFERGDWKLKGFRG